MQITKRFEFDAGHRVLGHESKCAYLHGHRYAAEITVESRDNHLDELGRVIDFSKIKEVVGKWIDDNWDHNMILHPDDPLATLFFLIRTNPEDAHASMSPGTWQMLEDIFDGKAPYMMSGQVLSSVGKGRLVDGMNPTAENMAMILFDRAYVLLHPLGMKVTKVRLYETPTCWAECGQ